jgi:hypothetical protein
VRVSKLHLSPSPVSGEGIEIIVGPQYFFDGKKSRVHGGQAPPFFRFFVPALRAGILRAGTCPQWTPTCP